MPIESSHGPPSVGHAPEAAESQFVDEESLLLRNYDSETTDELTVAFHAGEDGVAFREQYTLGPLMSVSVDTRIPRAVYDVVVTLDDGRRATAECLLGSGPEERAIVEVGNGLASVVWGGH